MRRAIWCVLCILMMIPVATCAGAVTYRARALDMPDGCREAGYAGINNSGWVCATVISSTGHRAYVWDVAGAYTRIPALAGDNDVMVNHLNANGTVAVASGDAQSMLSPCTWSLADGTVYRGTPEHPACTAAPAINDSGQLAGCTGVVPKVWNPDGSVLTLYNLPDRAFNVVDMNNSGVVIANSGRVVCKWDADGNYAELSIPANFTEATVSAINDFGWVVGSAMRNPHVDPLGWPPDPMDHAVMWDPSGNLIKLWEPPSDQTGSTACDINNAGQVLGEIYTNVLGVGYHSVGVWNSNGNYTELPSFDGLPAARAIAINDSGQVVGICSDYNSRDVLVVWDVVPEPASWACLLCGLSGSILFGLRRRE